MDKSIYVLKTPKSCEDCDLCVMIMGKHYCPPKGTNVRKGERDCSCPLVAVPEMMDPAEAWGTYGKEYIDGWNNRLKRILRGVNE